jgi:hypothetical protein
MVFSDQHKVIFIHIPKTGGTSIEKSLNCLNHSSGYGVENGKAMQHYTWKDYKKNYINRYNEYYKFSIIRNPYDKVLSDYYWLKNKITVDNFQNKTFDEYLDYCEHICKNKLYSITHHHDHFIPQYKFIFDDDKKLKVHEIFKFENFENVKKFMKSKYNCDINHENQNKVSNRIILSQKQKDRIYEIYMKDFKLLKYDK